MREDIPTLLSRASFVVENSGLADNYMERHGVESASVLTVCEDKLAAGIANMIADRIRGKTVVEIGGGVGLLAFYLGQHAKRVFCIEANPMWAASFTCLLFEKKPRNVSYLFGAAEEFVDLIDADVAVFASHSGIQSMKRLGLLFAPEVIDIYGEMIAVAPESFDATAVKLRSFS